MATPAKVHEGLWINLSEGNKVKGATLTLSQTKAAYLIAFLALYVHLSGASFWRFTSFALFRTRAHLTSRDKTALQQQAILRNGPSAIAALSNLVAAALRSKKRLDSLALSLWALANFVFFLAAGILSSKVANTDPDVLLQPTNCGRWWKFSFGGSIASWVLSEEILFEQAIQVGAVRDLHLTSSRFKSACYDGSELRNGCLWFVREPIAWTSSLLPGCPFGDDICVDNTTFTIESEWIESDRHLGINSQQNDRLRMQIRKTCSPLRRDGYFKTYDSANISTVIHDPEANIPYKDWKAFFNGPYSYGGFFYGEGLATDATFIYSNATRIPAFDSPQPAYSLMAQMYGDCSGEVVEAGVCQTSFNPIPQLRRSGKDTSLIFLTSEVEYCGPVIDPWFDSPVCDKGWSYDSNWQVCRPTYPTTALACFEENEIWVGDPTDHGKCVHVGANGYPFAGNQASGLPIAAREGSGLPNITNLLKLNPRQAQTASRIQDAIWRSVFVDIVWAMGGGNMLASNTASTSTCTPGLPNNQWTKEVENWFVYVDL